MHPLLTQTLDIDPTYAAALRKIPAKGGVYLLASEADQPILLAFAENIRRAITHRLTAPEAGTRTKRADLSAITRRIHWTETYSAFETNWVHWRVARELYPKTYREMIAFGPAWLLRIDPAAPHPRFTATTDLRDDDAHYFGPYGTQRDVDAWIQMLEDAFDLCRYHPVLELSPRGDRCAYFDMGKCPAPCDGTISMDAYRVMIRGAVDFTQGRRESRLADLCAAMQSAAAELAFEKAAGIRKTLDRAESIHRSPEFEFVHELQGCNWLVIQRASRPRKDPAKTLIRPYFVGRDSVHPGDACSLTAIDENLPIWLEALPLRLAAAAHGSSAPRLASETQSLVAKFLFQREKAAGVFLRNGEPHSIGAWIEEIRTAFTQPENPVQPDLFDDESD